MSYTSAIVVKNKTFAVDPEWTKRALVGYPSYYGIAAVVDDYDEAGKVTGKTMQVLRQAVDKDHPALNLETFETLQEDYKEDSLVAIFKRGSGLLPEDQQPFVLMQNEDESPALVAFVDGDYPGYIKTAATQSPAFFFVQEYLLEKINQIAQLSGGDMDVLMAELLKSTFKKDIDREMSSNRSSLTLFADNDKLISFHNNNLKREFDWGWVSNHCGLVEAEVQTVPAAVVAKGKSLASSLQPKGPVAAVPGKVVGQLAPPPKTETAIPAEEFWYPPVNLHGKALKSAYKIKHREFYGKADLPPNWEKRPGLKVPKGRSVVKSLSDLPAVVGNTALSASPAAAQVSSQEQPILSPKLVEAIQEDFLTRFDYVKKVVDASNNTIEDPEVLPALENQIPPVWDQLGMDLESFFKVKYEDLLWASQKYPSFSAQMVLNLLGIVIKYAQQEDAEKPVQKPSAPAGTLQVPLGGKRAKVMVMPRKTA